MNILSELEEFINEFNQNNDVDFAIDTIRIEFQKQYKKAKLDELGEWKKLQKNSNILHKLKKRLNDDEITSVYRLDTYDVYFYNKKDTSTNRKYRNAEMIIFAMKQYHKEPPPKELINKILSILKDVSNIDICLDIPYRPNIEALSKYFKLKQYIEPKSKKPTDTYYINNPNITMIEKITIYDKGFKNSLGYIMHRIEAKIIIPNIKLLAIPLYELKEVTNIARLSK
ncbi:hypothetical protein JHD47_04170 [Sulfurimonas sp. SAG-AH-194-L11]|nr:hypothetical protein [Sulfurimonas sp. SAG-AH-194-L11]MDF1877008.1 hypothetical protein [Sulfurimonas sp. SAG-AH-194-L11]